MNSDAGPAEVSLMIILFLLVNGQLVRMIRVACQQLNETFPRLDDLQREKILLLKQQLTNLNLINILCDWIGFGLLGLLIGQNLSSFDWWYLVLTVLAFVVINICLTELARRRPLLVGLRLIKWTIPVRFICYPLTKLFLIVKKYSINDKKKLEISGQQKIIANFQEMLLKESTDNDFKPETFKMVEGVISIHQKMVREIMIARTDAFMVDIQNDNDRNIDAIIQQPYSRIPVFNETKDNIVGVVHIKNLLRSAREEGFEHLKLRRIMQAALFIPETMTVDDCLIELKRTHNQMAILFDEYGGVVGLVTLEDIIEEIVGEISDESDIPNQHYQKIADNQYIVEGRLPLDDFNEEFGTHLYDNEVDTIAGYIIAGLSAIPADGEKVELRTPEDVILLTEKIEDSRILQVKVTLPSGLAIAHVQHEKQIKQSVNN
ncbi:hemolysin family protein [Liquorilactobacillus nagelii]|uniref:hemolysin family protein n=1 Tax=Liquorilactobacillus nagelii TaxID=82688 RepID=UPI0039E82C2A